MNMKTFFTSRDEADQAIRSRGLQPTSQRVEVLWQLHQSGRHLSADELHEGLVRGYSKVSRATVFNTLKLLKDHGLVNEIMIAPGRVLFDPNVEPHFHFYDVDTHELMDVPSETVGITCLPLLPDGASFQGLDVIVKISRERT